MKLHCFVSVLSAFFFLNKTKWLSGLHLVVLFLSCLFCVFCFSVLSQKKTKPDTAKTPKTKNAEEKDKQKIQLAQLCSQIVFLIFGGWATKMSCFAENTIKIGVWAYFEKGNKGKTLTKLLSWKSVQGWVENLSNYVAQHFWTDFRRKLMVFFVFCFLLFFGKMSFPFRKKKILEKQKKRRIWTDLQLKKWQFLDRFSTLQHIYI